METTDAGEMRDEAIKVRNCSNEIIDVLGKYLADDPGLAFTTIIFLLVRMSSAMNVPPGHVVEAVKKGFETEALLNLDTPNDWIN